VKRILKDPIIQVLFEMPLSGIMTLSVKYKKLKKRIIDI